MEYFTVMWITVLGGVLDGSDSGLIYKSLAECEAAIPKVVDTLVGQYDFNVICEETPLLAASPRPKRNPIYEE